jgi:hypothetical protein
LFNDVALLKSWTAVNEPVRKYIINGDNLQNLRCEASRIFRNKKREYLKGKINELETSNKSKNIRDLYRDINGFKTG